MESSPVPVSPPTSFWSVGQSLLLVCPIARWNSLLEQAYAAFDSSHFDRLIVGENGSVSMEEALDVRSESQKKPTQKSVRLCIIKHMDHATPEAANALLKCLEEPTESTRFILLAQTTHIPDTILSRCMIWKGFESTGHPEKLVPLENDLDFGTVSVLLAEIVAGNQSDRLIDQWTADLLQGAEIRHDVLHWLIELRSLFNTSTVNKQAFLELTYVSIKHHEPLPKSIERIVSTSYGHI